MSRHRGFAFTMNNYPEGIKEVLEQQLGARYVVGGYEVAPATGTPHLQGYAYFDNSRGLSATIKNFQRIHAGTHVEIARGTVDQNYTYCTKGGSYFSIGDKPMDSVEKGKKTEEDWTGARELAREGKFEDIPAGLYIRHQASLKRIHREDAVGIVGNLDPRPTYGLWIHGPPGTGKSHYARTTYPEHYMKGLNKWWCNYHGEKTVIIDEFNPECAKYLTDYIKRWADRWTFTAEYKGGSMVIRPELIIVTSNYSIEQCFTGVDYLAVMRRFEVMEMTEVYGEEVDLGEYIV